MEMIISHPDKPWCWSSISQNPNITMEVIDSHPDKPWDWCNISTNKFDKHPHMTKKRKQQRIFRKLIIVAKFLKAMNYEEVKYRPGNSGYLLAMEDFNKYK
jgi:hypothetical protein